MVYVVLGLNILSCVDSGVQRQELALSIGLKRTGFYPKTEIVSKTLFLNKKQNDG
jgi:hypothetical protein